MQLTILQFYQKMLYHLCQWQQHRIHLLQLYYPSLQIRWYQFLLAMIPLLMQLDHNRYTLVQGLCNPQELHRLWPMREWDRVCVWESESERQTDRQSTSQNKRNKTKGQSRTRKKNGRWIINKRQSVIYNIIFWYLVTTTGGPREKTYQRDQIPRNEFAAWNTKPLAITLDVGFWTQWIF